MLGVKVMETQDKRKWEKWFVCRESITITPHFNENVTCDIVYNHASC